MGYLQKVKDIGTIINAVGEAVKLSSMQLKLCIVGDGPQKETLKKIAKQQPKGCLIDFVGYKKDPFEYLKQGKVFRSVMPVTKHLKGTYEGIKGKSSSVTKWWQHNMG